MDVENIQDHDEEDLSEAEDDFGRICPLREDSKFILEGHTNAVLCVTGGINSKLLFTGGMDDKILVWNIESGMMITCFEKHEESITHLSLNQSETFLASADMNGNVIIWSVSGNQFNLLKKLETQQGEVVSICWHYSMDDTVDYLFTCDKSGTVQLWGANDDQAQVFYSQGKGCCASKMRLILNEKYVAVLYGVNCSDHDDCSNICELTICNVTTNQMTKVSLKLFVNDDKDIDEGFGVSMTSKKVQPNSELIAMGDWDQIIFVIVSENDNSISTKIYTVPINDCGLVDNIGFSDVLPYCAFGTRPGLLGVYDCSCNHMRQTWKYDSTHAEATHDDDADSSVDDISRAVTQLKWCPGKPVFVTVGSDGRVCVWDARAPKVTDVPTLWGHTAMIWDLWVADQCSVVATVSEDKTCRIFQL